MEDARIIDLFWARDPEAISAVEENWGGLGRSLAAGLLGSPEDAEECVSDALMRLWDSIPPQRPKSLRAYFTAAVRNLAIDRWRRDRLSPRLTELSRELEDCLPAADSAEQASQDREIVRVTEKWLRSLSAADRQLFLRRYWYGDSVAELAKRRGVPANRLAQKLLRLRNGLRRALEKEGISV